MGPIITLSIVQSALELGFIYALVALALFISFSILNIADLSTDGCFTLGCAVCASVTLAGHPVLGLLAAMAAGVCSGFVTAFLQTRLGIQSILAGIIVNTGLYTINIAVMGFASNLNLFACDSVFTWAKDAIGGTWYKLIVAAVIVALVGVLISLFLNTRLGLSIRATGDNPDMVRASSINTGMMITIGLCVANALTGLSGGLLAQYQKSCDINLGTGMVTIALAVPVKFWMFLFNRALGRKINSTVLQATAFDSLSDILTTSVVLIAVFLDSITSFPADGIAGVIVALLIIVRKHCKRKRPSKTCGTQRTDSA